MHRSRNTNEFGCYTSMHNATEFVTISLDSGQQIDDVYPYTMSKVTWEVRSAYDPWLTAVEVTEDTNQFGMTAFELRFLGFGLLF